MAHRKSSVMKTQIMSSEAALTSLEEALGHGDEQISKILEQFVRAVKKEALDEQEKVATKQQEQFEKDSMNEKHQHLFPVSMQMSILLPIWGLTSLFPISLSILLTVLTLLSKSFRYETNKEHVPLFKLNV